MIDNDDFDMPTLVDRLAIEQEDDIEYLSDLYGRYDIAHVQLKAFLEAFKVAGVTDEDWTHRTATKLAFMEMGKRWVERRLLLLKADIPYPPTDPRTRHLDVLQNKLKKLKGILRENNIAFEDAPA